jgi:hypothetical protein
MAAALCLLALACVSTLPLVSAGACTKNGVVGQCVEKSQCAAPGRLYAGLCPGGQPPEQLCAPSRRCCFLRRADIFLCLRLSFAAANIQCCIKATGAAAAPAAAAAAAPRPVASSSSALPCTYGGSLGSCIDRKLCGGKSYSGLCPGAANIQCCIKPDGGSRVPGVKRQARPRIVGTTLQRLSEKEHISKWLRFKSKHGKRYSSAAVERAAYLTFRQNRVRVIYLNDRFG